MTRDEAEALARAIGADVIRQSLRRHDVAPKVIVAGGTPDGRHAKVLVTYRTMSDFEKAAKVGGDEAAIKFVGQLTAWYPGRAIVYLLEEGGGLVCFTAVPCEKVQ